MNSSKINRVIIIDDRILAMKDGQSVMFACL